MKAQKDIFVELSGSPVDFQVQVEGQELVFPNGKTVVVPRGSVSVPANSKTYIWVDSDGAVGYSARPGIRPAGFSSNAICVGQATTGKYGVTGVRSFPVGMAPGSRPYMLPVMFREFPLPSMYEWPGPNFAIYQIGGMYLPAISAEDFRIDNPQVEMWVSHTYGNDSNNGLSPGAPKKTLGAAISALTSLSPDSAKLNLQAGVYVNTNHIDINFPIHIECSDGVAVILNEYTDGEEFTLYSGSIYQLEEFDPSAGSGVFDFRYRDEDGAPYKLSLAADLDACLSTPGTYYVDASPVCYIHLIDKRQPDSDVVAVVSTSAASHITFQRGGYVKNVRFVGHQRCVQVSLQKSDDILVFDNCEFVGSTTDDGLEVASDVGGVILQDCVVAYNHLDGINFHRNSSYQSSWLVELFTRSVANGWSGADTNQGSSVHDGVASMRFHGWYVNNEGRQIQDIGNGDQLLFKCYVSKSRSSGSTSSVGYCFGQPSGGDWTRAFLIECEAENVETHLGVWANSRVWTRRIPVRNWTTNIDSTAILAGF